jgi:polar amino acid transport system substrate-binding protein
VIVVATLAFGMPGASAQTKMKFAAEDKDLYPTYLGSGTDTLAEKPGVTVELIRIVAKDVGIEPVFVRAPWRRCMELLKEGEVDAVINGSYSSARAEFGAFPMQGEKPDDARKSHVWTYTLYRKKGQPDFVGRKQVSECRWSARHAAWIFDRGRPEENES